MRLLLSIIFVLSAGVLCGIPVAWAVNAKVSPLWSPVFAVLLLGGIVAGAWLYAPRS